MTAIVSRLTLVSVTALAAFLVVGGTALAHGGGGKGRGGHGPGGGGISTSLVNAAATNLGVTPAALKAAIVASAKGRVDAAVADGDLDAADAAELKSEAEDNLRVAYNLSRASTVATAAGKTTAQLNTAFRTARKAAITARINAALEDGDIDADEAAELKGELEDATIPGYKQSKLSRFFR
jgi:DNA recombination-dependent growth factor C